MRFWDSSAIVPLLIEEQTTAALQRLHDADPSILVWWGTEIECVSGLARGERTGRLTVRATHDGLARLDALRRAWNEIEPQEMVRRTARRLLLVHDLRAGDALQLAAALVASEGHAASLEFVSIDTGLLDAARREGLAAVETGEP